MVKPSLSDGVTMFRDGAWVAVFTGEQKGALRIDQIHQGVGIA